MQQCLLPYYHEYLRPKTPAAAGSWPTRPGSTPAPGAATPS